MKKIKRYIRKAKAFFKITKFKKGQVIQLIRSKEPIRLIKFIRYNNVYMEVWQFEYVNYPQLKDQDLIYGEMFIDGELKQVDML